jgi:hypothetical protein
MAVAVGCAKRVNADDGAPVAARAIYTRLVAGAGGLSAARGEARASGRLRGEAAANALQRDDGRRVCVFVCVYVQRRRRRRDGARAGRVWRGGREISLLPAAVAR